MLIFKIFRAEEWQQLQTDGRTAGAPIDLEDGYIHFSTSETVAETASRHFADQDELILAICDSDALGDDLKWEESRGGALFPHLYRDLLLSEVTGHHPLPLTGGRHVFPGGLL